MIALLIGLLWAQNATAWRWHQNTRDGSIDNAALALYHPGDSPPAFLSRLLTRKVVVARDTVYAFYTILDTTDGAGQGLTLTLPGLGFPILMGAEVTDNAAVAVLSAHSAQNGSFLWAMVFYATNGVRVRAADFLIDTVRSAIYGAVRTGISTGGHQIKAMYITSAGANSFFSTSVSNQRTAMLFKLTEYGRSLSTPPTFQHNFMRISSVSGDSWIVPVSLLLKGDTLFLSGTIYNQDISFSIELTNPLSFSLPSINLGPGYKAFLLRCKASNLEGERLLLIHGQQGFTVQPAHGRNILGEGNQLLWIIGIRGATASWRVYKNDGNLDRSGSFLLPSTNKTLLLITPLEAGELTPTGTYDQVAEYDATSIPPAIFSAWTGNILTLAWSDIVSYEIRVQNYSSGSRLYFWQGTHIGTSVIHLRHFATPTQPAGEVVLTGLSVETYERIFCTGALVGSGSRSFHLNSTTWLFVDPDNVVGGFLIGLRWRIGDTEPKLTGSHILRSNPHASWTGLDRDRFGHFYGCGWAEGTQILYPHYPAGDTVRKTYTGRGGLWVGKLEWYRLRRTPPVSRGVCTPNQIPHIHDYEMYGSLPNNTTVYLVWVPEAYSQRYPVAHHWQWIITARNQFASGVTNYTDLTLSGSSLPGRMPLGRYFCTAIADKPRLPVFYDLMEDTLWIDVRGPSAPYLIEANKGQMYFVSPLVGSSDPSHPYAHTLTTPHPIRQVRFQGRIVAIASVPWQFFSTNDQGEMLYLLENDPDNNRVRLYRVNLDSLRIFPPLRTWYRKVDPLSSQTYHLSLDSVAVLPASWDDPAHFQLKWNPFSGRLLLAERNSRIRAIDVYGTKDTLLIGARSSLSFSYSSIGYPRVGGNRYFTGGTYACDAQGDFILFAKNVVRTGLFRLQRSENDSLLLRAGGGINLPSSCDGTGMNALINHVQAAVVVEDTVWFADKVEYNRCGRLRNILLRRAYRSLADPNRDTVETIDTLVHGSYNSDLYDLYYYGHNLLEPFVVFSTDMGVFRYWIRTKARDTLMFCRGSSLSCCSYGMGDWVRPGGLVRIAPLRGGAWAVAGGDYGEVPVRLLSPVYCPSQTTDTLYSEVLLGNTTGGYQLLAGSSTKAVVHLPRRSQGQVDTTGTLHTPSCGGSDDAFSARFWTYRVPLLTISLQAPDTVCEGQRFYTIFSSDGNNIHESGCILLPYAISKQGNVISNPHPEGEGVFLWDALREGYDTIFLSVPARYSCFVQPNPFRHRIRVRQAHRLRLQVFPEGPLHPGPDTLRANPVLSYRNLIRYALGISGISSDSLWRLPVQKGETHWRAWLGAGYANRAACVVDSTPNNSPLCQPLNSNFISGVALVELYETIGGPRVDSAYVVIDRDGKAYPFLAGAYNWGFSNFQFDQDTLYFCMCDLSQPKWVVVRFPHHLPLRSPQALNLPTSGPPPTLDMRDPGNLAGTPGVHYRIMHSTSRSYAAAWAGNCADTYNSFLGPAVHYDTGVINAADWEFMRPRIGVVGSASNPALSWADLNNDGVVNALDATILIDNQNQLHRSARRGR